MQDLDAVDRRAKIEDSEPNPLMGWVPSLVEPDSFATHTRLLDLYNEARGREGISPLESHPALICAAEGHSEDMAYHNHLSHYGLSRPTTWADRCLEAGYPDASLLNIGENVAAGQTSPEMVISDYRQSPGHWRTLMDPRWRYVGSASRQGSRGWIYWTSDFGC